MSPGQRSRLFSEVNDRIYELLEAADPDLPGEFLCECGEDCGRRVELLPKAFASLREAGELVRSPDCLDVSFTRPLAGVSFPLNVPRGRRFAVADPRSAGERVLLRTRVGVWMLVQAKQEEGGQLAQAPGATSPFDQAVPEPIAVPVQETVREPRWAGPSPYGAVARVK